MTERTLVLIKPDGVGRGLTGQILDRYLAKGYDLVAMQLRTCTPELADAHYADHVAKDWYPRCVRSSPLARSWPPSWKGLGSSTPYALSTAPPTASQPRPGRSVATGRPPTARTSSTAPTLPSPPLARSASGSRNWHDRPESHPAVRHAGLAAVRSDT